jgi:hypothetical protein
MQDEFFNQSLVAKHHLFKRATPFILSFQPITLDQEEKVLTSFTDAIKLAIAALQDLDENPNVPNDTFNLYFSTEQEAQVKAVFASFFSEPDTGELGNPIFSNVAIGIGQQDPAVDVAQCSTPANGLGATQLHGYFL